MSYSYKKLNTLQIGKTYKGYITSISMVDADKEKERVLVNVEIPGYTQPNPASYYTYSKDPNERTVGARMLDNLLASIEAPEVDFKKLSEAIRGKEVNVRISMAKDGIHQNTSVFGINQIVAVESDTELQTEETMPLLG